MAAAKTNKDHISAEEPENYDDEDQIGDDKSSLG